MFNTNFSGASLCGANFSDTDLSNIVEGSLNKEQLNCSCINLNTILPDWLNFDYNSYKLPDECKESWPMFFDENYIQVKLGYSNPIPLPSCRRTRVISIPLHFLKKHLRRKK